MQKVIHCTIDGLWIYLNKVIQICLKNPSTRVKHTSKNVNFMGHSEIVKIRDYSSLCVLLDLTANKHGIFAHFHPCNQVYVVRYERYSTNYSVSCVADSRREGNSRNNSWLQLNHLFYNRGSRLSHTTDTA